jgi:hypothetical protein
VDGEHAAAQAVHLKCAHLRPRAGAKIGLLDYGQSKQLPDAERLAFAALLLELAGGSRAAQPERVAGALQGLGLRFARTDARLMTRMAFGMFDTQTTHRCAALSRVMPLG